MYLLARDTVYTLLADIHILSALCIARKHVKSGCLNNFWSHVFKKKVKVTLVQALRFCTGRKARRKSRGIALFFHDHGTRRG
jgi:hypothetical protein